ncbi:MAG: hypothetical protein JST50_06250 [Bacteroidetes bacterium]|jgi:hypothetical protein|nr:hypothetical protein [Bacteroidota bacterium]
MKVGFILECSPQGPDADIYPYLANIFCKKLELLKPETLINKQRLINEGPLVAQTLITDGCDYVYIIWDRMPKWGRSGKCEDDKNAIEQGLHQLKIDRDKIILCCISDMLESWMIIDGKYITKYFQQFSTHPLQSFGDNKSKSSQVDPKNRITKYNGRYNDYKDNFQIVKLIDDFSMHVRWNESFKFFKESLESICLK